MSPVAGHINGMCFLCDGCKKIVRAVELPDNATHPPGWLFWNGYPKWEWSKIPSIDKGPWVGAVSACSADCVEDAKKDAMARARAAVERFCKRVMDSKLERVADAVQCNHQGIGKPGCTLCDPRTKAEGGPREKNGDPR